MEPEITPFPELTESEPTTPAATPNVAQLQGAVEALTAKLDRLAATPEPKVAPSVPAGGTAIVFDPSTLSAAGKIAYGLRSRSTQ